VPLIGTIPVPNSPKGPLSVAAPLDKTPETHTAEPDDDRYRVHSPVEMASILRAIMHAGIVITAYFDQGKDFVLTAILDVDTETGHVLVDSGSTEQLNERLLRSRQLTLVSTLDGVKVEYLEAREPATFERTAFKSVSRQSPKAAAADLSAWQGRCCTAEMPNSAGESR
jgi:hypothetical protein